MPRRTVQRGGLFVLLRPNNRMEAPAIRGKQTRSFNAFPLASAMPAKTITDSVDDD